METGVNRRKSGKGCDQSLSRSHVAIKEPVHRLGFFEILENLHSRFFLRAGKFERKGFCEVLYGFFIERYFRGAFFFPGASDFERGDLEREHFLKGEPFLGEYVFLRVLWKMDIFQRGRKGGEV